MAKELTYDLMLEVTPVRSPRQRWACHPRPADEQGLPARVEERTAACEIPSTIKAQGFVPLEKQSDGTYCITVST
jgi:hypothetical protein